MQEKELSYLIAGCKKNDAQCQKKLYQLMYDYGMSIAARYGQNLPETEEIANDGFFKMLKHIDRYQGQGPFKLWLRKIITNCGIDHYRKIQSQKNRIIELKTQFISNEGSDMLESEYLLKLVRRLSPGYRMVFVLHVMEGYNHDEIAAKLNISKGTSKSNLAKARKKLQDMLHIHNRQVTEYGK